MKSVSVIIAAKNHLEEHTIPCLDALLQNTAHPYRLILVDDGSIDGTAQYMATIPGAKVIRFSKSEGVSVVRNEALARSELADLSIFLDNDTRPPPGWLKILVEESQKAKVGVIGGIPSNEYPRMYQQQTPDGLIDSMNVSGACMGITRECIETVGLLDEWLYNCGEDTDFCYRARLAGFRIVHTPRLMITHYPGGTRGKTKRERQRIYICALRFRRKYRNYRSIFPMPPLYPFG